MTANDFKNDPAKCEWLKRMMASNTFREALAAAFETFDIEGLARTRSNLQPSENFEIRIHNQRAGMTTLKLYLEDMCEPNQKPSELPEETYGADELVPQKGLSQSNGWTELGERGSQL